MAPVVHYNLKPQSVCSWQRRQFQAGADMVGFQAPPQQSRAVRLRGWLEKKLVRPCACRYFCWFSRAQPAVALGRLNFLTPSPQGKPDTPSEDVRIDKAIAWLDAAVSSLTVGFW